MRRLMLLLVTGCLVVGCGDDSGSSSSADSAGEEESSDATTESVSLEPSNDEMPTDEGVEACLLKPSEIAEITGVGKWSVNRVVPNGLIDGRAQCEYYADPKSSRVTLDRTAGGDVTALNEERRGLCADGTFVEAPANLGAGAGYCTLNNEQPIAWGSSGGTFLYVNAGIKGEDPGADLHFALLDAALTS